VDPRENPYSPGAGVRPAELAGRSSDIEAFDVVLVRATAGRPAQSMVFYGLRGVGKTVLLNELHAMAEQRGWVTAKVEGDQGPDRTSFRRQVAGALNTSLRHVQGRGGLGERVKTALGTFHSFAVTASPDGTLSIGVTVEPAKGRADTGAIQVDLTDLAVDLGAAAAELGVGAMVFIDEMQHLEGVELAAVCQACHETSQRNLPFFVVGAGLPNLPGLLAVAKSYSERLYQYIQVDRLNRDDALSALVVPAEVAGVEWEPAAVAAVLDAANGYPYFIQQYGKATWDAAGGSPISSADAADGVALGRQQLDAGFFRARWERSTPAEREYLHAMAVDDDAPSLTKDVAARLNRKATSLGPVRASLISKGLVFTPERGYVAFTVPGMAAFIQRHAEAT
jgi:hypothetical protein